jgi:ATP-dependent RNA helicase DBP3
MGKRKDSTDAGLEPGAAVTRDEQEKEKKEKKQKKEKKEKKEKKDKKEKKEKKDKKDKKQKKDKAASSADDGSSALKRSPAAAAAASAPPPKKHKSSSSTPDLQPRRSPRLAAAGGGGCGGPPALSLSLGSQGASAEEQQRLDPKHVDLQPAHMLLQHPPVPQFNALVALGVPQWLISATCSGFAQPTLVQQHTWPLLLAGKDVIAVARTGSGKTLAFAIPALVMCLAAAPPPKSSPLVLTIAPTRELACQTAAVVEKAAAAASQEFASKMQIACVYGGVDKQPQRLQCRAARVLVATPGRLLDLVDEGAVALGCVQMFVLDEADRMLDMGFEREVRSNSPFSYSGICCAEEPPCAVFTLVQVKRIAALVTKDKTRNVQTAMYVPSLSLVAIVSRRSFFVTLWPCTLRRGPLRYASSRRST